MATRLITRPVNRARSDDASFDAASADNPPLLILGIDPGLERTGYAVLERSDTVRDAGLIRSNPRASLASRLGEIAASLDEVMDEWRPQLVAVEELFAHYKHPRTAILMGHVRGVVLLAAARRGIGVLGLPSTHIKKALTGNGHAGKAQVQRAIQATLNLKRMPQQADVADALAIAWCAAVMNTKREIGSAGRSLR
jgi:crossover junction endodeoxyribonuclease RuvC